MSSICPASGKKQAGASASGVSYTEGREPTTVLYHRQAGEGRNTVQYVLTFWGNADRVPNVSSRFRKLWSWMDPVFLFPESRACEATGFQVCSVETRLSCWMGQGLGPLVLVLVDSTTPKRICLKPLCGSPFHVPSGSGFRLRFSFWRRLHTKWRD